MDNDQIKHMVNRFLMWKLPEHFRPDCGIIYTPIRIADGRLLEPSGTNLLDATQAEAMVRHMIEGLPAARPASGEREGEGCSEGAFDNAYKDFMKRRIVDLTYLVGKHVDPNVVEPELEPLVLDCADEIDENAAKRALRKAEHVEDIPVEALFAMQEQALKRESAHVGFDETGMRGARPTPHPRQPVRMKILRLSFVWNYKGHNSGLFQRGPNWWQITLPPSRKMFRCALIAVKQ